MSSKIEALEKTIKRYEEDILALALNVNNHAESQIQYAFGIHANNYRYFVSKLEQLKTESNKGEK